MAAYQINPFFPSCWIQLKHDAAKVEFFFIDDIRARRRKRVVEKVVNWIYPPDVYVTTWLLLQTRSLLSSSPDAIGIEWRTFFGSFLVLGLDCFPVLIHARIKRQRLGYRKDARQIYKTQLHVGYTIKRTEKMVGIHLSISPSILTGKTLPEYFCRALLTSPSLITFELVEIYFLSFTHCLREVWKSLFTKINVTYFPLFHPNSLWDRNCGNEGRARLSHSFNFSETNNFNGASPSSYKP